MLVEIGFRIRATANNDMLLLYFASRLVQELTHDELRVFDALYVHARTPAAAAA